MNIPRPARPARPRIRHRRDPRDYRTGGSTARRRPPPTKWGPFRGSPVPASEHQGRIKPPTPERPTAQINPLTHIDIGTTSFLDDPKPPKNETLKGMRAAHPRASTPPQNPKNGQPRRRSAYRLPSGRRYKRNGDTVLPLIDEPPAIAPGALPWYSRAFGSIRFAVRNRASGIP